MPTISELDMNDPDKLAMLIDSELAMTMFIMAKVCSHEEIEIFLTANQLRQSEQGFEWSKVKDVTNSLRGSIEKLIQAFNE